MSADSSAGATAPAALTAFVRGVERRALAFAWLLAGSRDAGGEAVAWAVARFRREAGTASFGDWPRRFWALLLAAPTLRRPPDGPRWSPAFAPLARIGHGPRAALLLRLVAGLAESDAAAVLGTSRATYRLAVSRAMPHGPDGHPDVEALRTLSQATQELQRAVPPEGAARTADADGSGAPPGWAGTASRSPAGPRTRAALWLVALLTLAALAATFLWPGGLPGHLPAGLEDAPHGILAEPLPPAEDPAGRYPRDAALALHPDLALLLAMPEQDAASADPAFHAWLLAGADDQAATARNRPVRGPAGSGSAGTRPAEDVAADARARLERLDGAARERLEARRRRWDALPPAERGAYRERWLAWQSLPPAEQRLLRVEAERHARLSVEEQAELRARFDALDASDRRGWLLGPDLGADYPRLHPLIAQVPAEARDVLLDTLRGLDAQARDDLAVLAVRTPPEARAELRIELLATPPEQRGRWLRRRVSPPQ